MPISSTRRARLTCTSIASTWPSTWPESISCSSGGGPVAAPRCAWPAPRARATRASTTAPRTGPARRPARAPPRRSSGSSAMRSASLPSFAARMLAGVTGRGRHSVDSPSRPEEHVFAVACARIAADHRAVGGQGLVELVPRQVVDEVAGANRTGHGGAQEPVARLQDRLRSPRSSSAVRWGLSSARPTRLISQKIRSRSLTEM